MLPTTKDIVKAAVMLLVVTYLTALVIIASVDGMDSLINYYQGE